MAIKKFVQVIAKFEEDGRIIPLQVLWEDGRVFDIDRVLDMIRTTVNITGDAAGCVVVQKSEAKYN